jgi:uncharacterized phage-associated protein
VRNSMTCHVVADYFLLMVDSSAGDTISNLKLQKLCYFAQGWSLALHAHPLFSEPIEAWAHGPVVRDLYERFRKYSWQAIDPTDLQTDPVDRLSEEDRELLDTVWAKYGGFTGRQLEAMTHVEASWKDARGARGPMEYCNEVITHAAMRAHFGQKLSTRHGANPRSHTA